MVMPYRSNFNRFVRKNSELAATDKRGLLENIY